MTFPGRRDFSPRCLWPHHHLLLTGLTTATPPGPQQPRNKGAPPVPLHNHRHFRRQGAGRDIRTRARTSVPHSTARGNKGETTAARDGGGFSQSPRTKHASGLQVHAVQCPHPHPHPPPPRLQLLQIRPFVSRHVVQSAGIFQRERTKSGWILPAATVFDFL